MTTPPPLPPAERTVGQLVAESISFYGHRFWAVLPLGLAVAAINQVSAGRSTPVQATVLAAGAPLMAAAFARACALLGEVRVEPSTAARAVAVGSVVWVPAAFLSLFYVLPAIAWLALVGLVVPVLVLERPPLRPALSRAVQLARADYVHALASLATLVILFGLVKLMLVLLLRDLGDSGERAALALADLVVSPLLFVGGAILYVDQSARVSRTSSRKRSAGGVKGTSRA